MRCRQLEKDRDSTERAWCRAGLDRPSLHAKLQTVLAGLRSPQPFLVVAPPYPAPLSRLFSFPYRPIGSWRHYSGMVRFKTRCLTPSIP